MHKLTKHVMSMLFMLVVSLSSYANELDQAVLNMSENPQHLDAGQTLYRSICATCHHKDLSGAMGFNLKDGEWVHGSTPSDIVKNISQGFSNAGMPAFGPIFSAEQIKQIAAYVISQRQGFDQLTYKIYQLTDQNDFSIADKKPYKTGRFSNNLIDFLLPEIELYALEVEGDFYTLRDQATQLYIDGFRPNKLDIEIDGELLAFPTTAWFPSWPLKKGKQHIKMTFYSNGLDSNYKKNPNFLVTDPKNTIRLFPVSTHAHRILSNAKVELKAVSNVLVQRKRIYQLPAYSIAVGYPNKVNYAFNTQSCSVVGVWNEDLLNIGPNVINRGTEGSIPLGDFLFKSPEQITIAQNESTTCEYTKYSMAKNGNPTFYFSQKGIELALNVVALSATQLQFNYQLLNQHAQNITLNLPPEKGFTLQANQGEITHQQLSTMLNPQQTLSLTMTFKGK